MGGGVPAQDADSFRVSVQFDNGFCQRRGQPAVWDLPDLFNQKQTWCSHTALPVLSQGPESRSYHDAAVLRTTGDDVVVVGTELNVQDRTCVAADGGVGHVDTSGLEAGTLKRILRI